MTAYKAIKAQKPERAVWPDFLKGISIICVVSIHVGIAFSECLRFCIPLFIAVWAYHYEQSVVRRHQRDITRYAARRLISILVPFLTWTLLYLIIFTPLSSLCSGTYLHQLNRCFGGYAWSGQYFFVILFQLTILFFWFRLAVNSATVWIFIIGGGCLNIATAHLLFADATARSVGDRLFVYWVPYVAIGIAFARHILSYQARWLPVAFVALACTSMETSWIRQSHDVSPYLTASVTIGSLALVLAFGPGLQLEQNWINSRLVRWPMYFIASIGQKSMCIYVAHILFLNVIQMLAPQLTESWEGKILTIGLAITGCTALGNGLRRLGFGVFIGE